MGTLAVSKVVRLFTGAAACAAAGAWNVSCCCLVPVASIARPYLGMAFRSYYFFDVLQRRLPPRVSVLVCSLDAPEESKRSRLPIVHMLWTANISVRPGRARSFHVCLHPQHVAVG